MWREAPRPLQILASTAAILVFFTALNLGYHVLRKPTEMFFPVAGALTKLPAETWRQYEPLFRANSTAAITPELLAALAQVELAAVELDRAVADILARPGVAAATPRQKEELAALVHLCGAGAADGFARRGFRLLPGQRCGDHEAAAYLARVESMERLFARFATEHER
jgi:hypothetical protein